MEGKAPEYQPAGTYSYASKVKCYGYRGLVYYIWENITVFCNHILAITMSSRTVT